MKKRILILLLAGFISACSTTTPADRLAEKTQGWSVEQLYSEAQQELKSSNYSRAIGFYALLQSRYPHGRFAQQAMIDTAYAYYLDGAQQLALNEIAQFIKLYPNHPKVDYLYYLRALVLMNEDRSLGSSLAPQNWSERDASANRDSYLALQELVMKFPNSRYVADAQMRMVKIIDALGEHEITIARYYMQRGAYLAAIGRAQNVVIDFRNTAYLEEALALMMTAYDKIEQPTMAADTRRVLQLNFPQSRYLKHGWFAPQGMAWWSFWHRRQNTPKPAVMPAP